VVAFALLDNVFLGIFIMEILLKWYCNFWDYWRSGWNILDILITGTSVFKTYFPIMGKFSIFRILRVLQPFKSNSLSLLSGLQIVVTTIVDSVPDMANMAIILVVWMYIYAIVGVALFSDIIPFAFGDIGKTMYTLFISFTQIGWVEILDQLEIKGHFIEGSIYFLSFILVGVFIFMKTVVAVVVANLVRCKVTNFPRFNF
jgi:cation channel sperm-associated protein 4